MALRRHIGDLLAGRGRHVAADVVQEHALRIRARRVALRHRDPTIVHGRSVGGLRGEGDVLARVEDRAAAWQGAERGEQGANRQGVLTRTHVGPPSAL